MITSLKYLAISIFLKFRFIITSQLQAPENNSYIPNSSIVAKAGRIDLYESKNRNAHSRISWRHRRLSRLWGFPCVTKAVSCCSERRGENSTPAGKRRRKGMARVCKGGRTLERTRYAFVTRKCSASGSFVGGCESAGRAVCRRAPSTPPGRAHRPFYYPDKRFGNKEESGRCDRKREGRERFCNDVILEFVDFSIPIFDSRAVILSHPRWPRRYVFF